MATIVISFPEFSHSKLFFLQSKSAQLKNVRIRTLRTGNEGNLNDDQVSKPKNNPFVTRLGQLLEARRNDLMERFRNIQKNLPLKVFLLLLGFYSANALATVLGQTGDWDVLVAAIMVAVTEGIGYLMYKGNPLTEKLRFAVRMLNYWKAGLSFGLFVDAFKLGS